MKVQREGNNKFTRVVVTEEFTKYVIAEYQKGRSVVSISKETECSQKRLSDLLKSNNIPIHTDREQALRFSCDERFFEKIDTEEKAYWLGFLYADGYITKARKHNNPKFGITITESDKKHLEKFKKALKYNGNIHTYQPSKSNYKNTKSYCRLLIGSPKIVEDLKKLGCVESKTTILKYPTEEQVPLSLQKHFIRGYIDGDGSLIAHKVSKSPNPHYRSFTLSITGTLEMIEGIKSFLNKKETKIVQRYKDRAVNNYTLTIGGNDQVMTMIDFFYKGATIYLDRKYEKYLLMKKMYDMHFIVECDSNIT